MVFNVQRSWSIVGNSCSLGGVFFFSSYFQFLCVFSSGPAPPQGPGLGVFFLEHIPNQQISRFTLTLLAQHRLVASLSTHNCEIEYHSTVGLKILLPRDWATWISIMAGFCWTLVYVENIFQLLKMSWMDQKLTIDDLCQALEKRGFVTFFPLSVKTSNFKTSPQAVRNCYGSSPPFYNMLPIKPWISCDNNQHNNQYWKWSVQCKV